MSNNEPTPVTYASESKKEEILRRFRRASPTDTPDLAEKIEKNQDNNRAFEALATHLLDTVPFGRNLATALTHLQTAKFFANEANITGE